MKKHTYGPRDASMSLGPFFWLLWAVVVDGGDDMATLSLSAVASSDMAFLM